MSANIFGSRFVIATFGESHGPGLGVVIDGCPAGVRFDKKLLQAELRRRRPGRHGCVQDDLVSARREEDVPEVLSGVFRGRTLGTPISMMVRNRDARPRDYALMGKRPRPGHADELWRLKFGLSDPRGGGRSSGRETVSRVMAGAVARMFLRQAFKSLRVTGFARQIGPMSLSSDELEAFSRRAARPS